MILRLELPEGLVVSFTLIDPKEAPVSFGDTLLDATRSPLTGSPRRPAVVRVAHVQQSMEIQRVLPDVEIVQAPTPELGEILEMMNEAQAGIDESEPASYFEDGRVSSEPIDLGTSILSLDVYTAGGKHLRSCWRAAAGRFTLGGLGRPG